MNHPSNRKPWRAGSGEGLLTLLFGVENCWSAGSGFPPSVSNRTVSVDLGSAPLVSVWSTVYIRLLVKGCPSCLPVMVMAAGPGWWVGMSACHESLFLLSANAWPSMLADSRVGACAVSSLAGLPGWPCLSRLQVNMSPFVLRAMILLSVLAACTYN